MIVTGYKKRSFSDQTGDFSYYLSLNVDNTLGECRFGFSGDTSIDFRLRNGKVYDKDDHLIFSYESDVSLIFSGDVSSESEQLFINGNPIYLEKQKPTGRISWFYIDPEDVEARFNLFFYGQNPDFGYDTSASFGSGDVITGKIINNNPDIKFRIFSGEILNNSEFTLSGITTGDIANTGYFHLVANDNDGLVNNVPLRFYTNFGDLDFNFIAEGNDLGLIDSPDIYLLLDDNADLFLSNDSSSTLLFRYRNPNTASLQVQLDYYSGHTGDLYVEAEFKEFRSDTIGGNIIGQGIISEYYEDQILATDATGLETPILGGGFLTGFTYATGDLLYQYKVKGTGLGTGYIYVDVNASGNDVSDFSGYIAFFGGGTLTGYKQNVDGTGVATINNALFTTEGVIPEAESLITINYFPGEIGDVFLDSSSYDAKFFEAEGVVTGLLQKDYSLIATGLVSGVVKEGVVDDRFFSRLQYGDYVFGKEFEGYLGADAIKTYDIDEILKGKPVKTTFYGWAEGYFTQLKEIRDCTIPVPDIEIVKEVSDCDQGLQLINCMNCDDRMKDWEFCNIILKKYFTESFLNQRFWDLCNSSFLRFYQDPLEHDGWDIDIPIEITSPPFKPPVFINKETYILIYVDASGSMNNELPAIRSMVSALKILVPQTIDGYDPDKIQIIELGNERWASWLGGASANLPMNKGESNLIVFAYINESHPDYHDIPFAGNKSLYDTDRNFLSSEMQQYFFYKGRVFAIQPRADSRGFFSAFKFHLSESIKENTGDFYLNNRNYVSKELDVPAGRRAEEYVAQIITILNSIN